MFLLPPTPRPPPRRGRRRRHQVAFEQIVLSIFFMIFGTPPPSKQPNFQIEKTDNYVALPKIFLIFFVFSLTNMTMAASLKDTEAAISVS